MISILILTLNEEVNLPACLASVAWSDDVVVFDSFSSDRTVEIARAYGARVEQRRFDNYAAQRNAALKGPFRHQWVLMMDADEVVTDELHQEVIEQIGQVSPDIDMFRMRRKDHLFGRWLRRSSGYPTWFQRLFRVGHVWIEREINEEMYCNGGVLNLKSHFLHYPFNKGVAFWLERHNRYSSMEAIALTEEMQKPLQWHLLFSHDPVLKRKAQKQLAYRLPFRPVAVFVFLYFARFGCLDRYAGFTYCCLRSLYEYMIDLKIKELSRKAQGMSV